ncbi:peptide chain release factor N(5)-glutamine methyltransferase [Ignatzschineria cameli]|uniref:Release factor glutamine methyltransferase n=1 Tax=Ignatzschineria cameli TaxID=2182793 RepID=A0A2U2AQN8_9GAMM|nr:peptide chain release factor N(5)-glutamine methyltransferase [Ignatzschineria cameli]PWD82964.1 peptide chain release factor N(5)-glutamine methyltransferase [Ignatzschineria cameli]PWD85866.1 peptide chain release factor N(5)-glutamine methyltransferase [Ignatzschineria cameli]PWD89494.1 peptide chain release factor N(5)-glutamine methyltransferase [Ignatzschineria cameli]PWD90966.1 peptide chain release factor N(5)-glutamine methyltransferase [Ignatzschineria cameli]PWD91754.1 peptide ch
MTIADAILEGKRLLAHLPSPQFEAELLLSYLLDRNRSYLIAFPEKALSSSMIEAYRQLLMRRAAGEPFAYISGEKEFYGLQFTVNQETLIPRDDTEVIVEAALERIPITVESAFSLLDLGTGSGAIALAIKKYRPDIEVTAVDYYPQTLKVAAQNAQRNNLDIEFIESNWFSALPKASYHLILSNPPYIDPIDPHLEGDGVKYEPKQALIAADKGLSDLFHLIENAPLYFKESGWLLLEHGFDQGVILREKMAQVGYQSIETRQDYGGNDRVTLGFYSSTSRPPVRLKNTFSVKKHQK